MQKTLKTCRRKFYDFLYYNPAIRRINCTLTHREATTLANEARRAGRKSATFLKQSAFAYLEKRYLVPRDQEEKLNTMVALMRNMASNLNQVARKTNKFNKVFFFDILKAKKTVHDLEEMLKNFIRQPQDFYVDKIHEPENRQLQATPDVYEKIRRERKRGGNACP